MHSTVIFIEGFSTSRLEQWFQASQVLSRIICMAKGFCSWHLTNSYDEQLRSYARRERCDFFCPGLGQCLPVLDDFFRLKLQQFGAVSASQAVKPNKKDRHWHNMHNMKKHGTLCGLIDSSTMQHHSANRKRTSMKIFQVPASNVFMRPDTTTPAPEFPVFVWAYKTHAFSCHVASLENWKVSHMQSASNITSHELKNVKMDADLPCQEIMRKMKRRRVRRLTWWICQVRSFCWSALAAIQLPTSNKKHPTHVHLYGVRPVILAMNILCIKAWNLLGLSWFGVTARLDWRRCGRFSWSFLSKLTSRQHFW